MVLSRRKDEIVDEFEKKSAALLDYLNSLEAAYERQRLDFEQREAQFKREKSELKYMLEAALEKDRKLEIEKAVLVKERDKALERAQELEVRNEELQQEMQKREELYEYKLKREEKARRKLAVEGKALKKKATVGWMLGSLCEVYLEGAADGGTLPLMLMLRKLQKDLENEVANFDCSIKLTTDSINKEVNRLLHESGSPKIQIKIQESRAGSVDGGDDEIVIERRFKSASPPRFSSGRCSPCSFGRRSRDVSPARATAATSPLSRPRSPVRPRSPPRSPSRSPPRQYSRSPSPGAASHSSCSTTVTVNFDDVGDEEALHFHCRSQPGSHVDTVEISNAGNGNRRSSSRGRSRNGRKKPWAEVKVVRDDEGGGGVDIKNLISSIEANINYLLDSERKRRWKESQNRNHLNPKSRAVRPCCKAKLAASSSSRHPHY